MPSESEDDLRRASVDDLLRTRRTVHEFDGRIPPRHLVQEALDLARWVPNHRLTNPWKWYWLGRRTIEKVCGLNARMVRLERGEEAARKKLERWLKLPGWLVLTAPVSVHDPVRHQEDYAACCCAALAFSYAMWARGLGVKWTTGPVTRHPEFLELLGIDALAEHVVGIFWYGYAAEILETKRAALSDHLVELP